MLQVESAAKSIQTSFSFRQFSPISPPVSGDPMGGLSFNNGESKQDGVTIGIQQLVIEPRRIILNVHSTSEIANKVFQDIVDLLRQLDPRTEKPAYAPILFTEETLSTVRFDFSMSRLFDSNSLHLFSESLKDRITNYASKPMIMPSAVHWHIPIQICQRA